MAEARIPNMTAIKNINPDINTLPGNSNVSKEHPQDGHPKQTKVISGQVKVRKPGLGRKFADAFFGEDVQDVKSYILRDVLVPTIKATISDVIGGGVEMLLFGRVSNGRRGMGGVNNVTLRNYTPYGTAYTNVNNQTGRPQTRSFQAGRYSVQDLVFNSRAEAETVLDTMISYLRQYDGMVSVADLYDMVGVIGAYTDHSWGWTDLTTASVRRVPDGYLLVLPRPVSLK